MKSLLGDGSETHLATTLLVCFLCAVWAALVLGETASSLKVSYKSSELLWQPESFLI